MNTTGNKKCKGVSQRRLYALALLAVLLFTFTPSGAAAQIGYAYHYSYTYDFWGSNVNAPSPYRVSSVLNSAALKLDKYMSLPTSLFIKNDRLFIVDSGNHRILQLMKNDGRYEVERIISSFKTSDGESSFNTPGDIFVTEQNELFICDTMNERIVKLDWDLNLLMAITKPKDETFDQRLAFLPVHIVADKTGRAFVQVRNVNKGLAKFENNGAFTGFTGANPVSYSIGDQIWRLLSTRAQREQQASYVPTEFDNIYIDDAGFIYSVTSTFQEYDLLWDKARPIRKLNALGADILVKNGEFPPIGDIFWGTAAGYKGPSKFTDITVLDNEVYVALDRVRGRLFAYDDQGRNLWIFGGAGNVAGYFRSPVSIEHSGYDLLVLDSQEASVTIFEPTQYGQLIYEATERYRRGEYSQSAQSWNEVLKLNGNLELAYIGVGRALLRENRYEEAMRYFKLANDERNYSKAFQEYRKIWVEENIAWIFSGLMLLILVPMIAGRVKKIQKELKEV